MYVNAYIFAVKESDKEEYRQKAARFAEIAKEFGVLEIFENWEVDVPDGEHTDYRKAVNLQPGEKVVVSWMVWPDRKAGAIAHKGIYADPRVTEIGLFPVDSKRMVLGGFEPIYTYQRDNNVEH